MEAVVLFPVFKEKQYPYASLNVNIHASINVSIGTCKLLYDSQI